MSSLPFRSLSVVLGMIALCAAQSPMLLAQPSVVINDRTVTEGSEGTTVQAVFTVTLSGATTDAVTVDYGGSPAGPNNPAATAGGACGLDNGVDLVSPQGTLQFDPNPQGGNQTQSISVTVCGDDVDEGVEERFRIDLLSAVGATITDPRGLLRILDDDDEPAPLPTVSIDSLSFPEGNAGNTQNAIVRLSAPASQTVSVLIGARPGGTATEGACGAGRDVTFAMRTVTIEPGQPQVTVPFTICGDTAQEPNESFSLGLLSPVNATIGNDRGVLTILNDDDPTPLNVSIRDATFFEGNTTSEQLVGVRLSAPTTQAVTVLVGARPGGTATEGSCGAGRDATFAFRSVTIEPGRTDVGVPLTLCGDTVFEPDDSLSVGLTGAVNAALGDSIGKVTIRNDDPAPGAPNLVVSIDESPPFETQVGPLLSHEVTVRNTGAGPASNVLLQSTLPRDVRFLRAEANEFSVCTGNTTDAAGQVLVRCTVSSLPAGASRDVRIVGEIAGSIPDSTRVVFGVQVDPLGIVQETSETDNMAFLSTTVRMLSDVQVAVKQVASIAEKVSFIGGVCSRGYTIHVNLAVKNNGPFGSRATTMSAAWPDGFRADGSSCFDTCIVPALGPGRTTDVAFRGALDAALGGTLRARFTVDPAGTLLDPIIANNTTTATVCEGR